MSGARPEGERKVISLSVAIDRDEVLHFLGYPEGQSPSPRIARLADDTIADARRLVSPRGTYVRHPVERSQELGLEPIDAAALVVGLVTIGGELERHASDWMGRGQATRALLMDAAGSAAVEETADRLCAVIAGESGSQDSEIPAAHVSCRISPGFADWSIRSQKKLFGILPYRQIGVSLLPSMLMAPRKSISFAMWLGADQRPLAGLSGCVRCELVECRYRRSVEAKHG